MKPNHIFFNQGSRDLQVGFDNNTEIRLSWEGRYWNLEGFDKWYEFVRQGGYIHWWENCEQVFYDLR